MDPVLFGATTFALLLGLLLLGAPVAYALALTVLAMHTFVGDAGQSAFIANAAYHALDSIELVALPMFIFMGAVIAASPAGPDIYRALHRLLPVPGGLGVSTVGGCALFSSLSGSSPATVAAIGSSGVPEMLARGYPPRLACGVIVGGGTLGILIPPSIVLLLYGIVTETSIGQLFLAGIVPGLMVAGLFALYTSLYMRRHIARLSPAQRAASAAAAADPAEQTSARDSLRRVTPFFVMVAAILTALYGGWATPSEIAAVGASASVVLVAFVYRIREWRVWHGLLMKTVRDCSMILIIAAFSYYLAQLLSLHGAVGATTELLVNAFPSPWLTLLALWLVMLLLGCFLPPFAIVVIVGPMFLPFALQAGFDPVWFGIFITLNMEMGCITPPIGINLFVVKAIAPEVPMRDIMIGSLPFLAILAFASLLLTLFPEIALALPGLMSPGR